MKSKLSTLIREHRIFGQLDPVDINLIVNNMGHKRYGVGEYIFHQNDESEKMYIMLDGQVSIEVVSLLGQITHLATLSEGEIFGEFALIDGRQRSASAQARKSTEIAYLTKSRFLDLMMRNPKFSLELAANLVARLRRTNLQIESFVTRPLKNRLLLAILEMCEAQGSTVIMLTQEKLAEIVSASREKVNVNLKGMEREGLIALSRGRIKVLDLAAVEKKIWKDEFF